MGRACRPSAESPGRMAEGVTEMCAAVAKPRGDEYA